MASQCLLLSVMWSVEQRVCQSQCEQGAESYVNMKYMTHGVFICVRNWLLLRSSKV